MSLGAAIVLALVCLAVMGALSHLAFLNQGS
jgi:hypothetical protein